MQNKSHQQNTNQKPITMILTLAKNRMISATADIMNEFSIPAVMMEGIVAGVLADVRAQVSANLITDFDNQIQSQMNSSREGEKIE